MNRSRRSQKLNRDASKVDFSRSAVEIARQIRGMYPWPGCRARILDADREIARVTLVRARTLHRAPHMDRVNGVVGDGGLVTTGDGSLEIVQLQPEGKRPMALHEFQNGHPWKAGMRLEAIG